MKKAIFTLLVAVFTACTTQAADVLTLKNGQAFAGTITRLNMDAVHFKSAGHKHTIPLADVLTLQFADSASPIMDGYLAAVADDDKCQNGRNDARNYHGKKFGNFCLGFFFGPIGLAGTMVGAPKPWRGRETPLMSTHKDQFTDPAYLKCYRSKARGQAVSMAGIGWGCWILIVLL